jgi:hypothetical protein
MIHHFDHRLGTYQGQTEAQANVGTLPRLTPEQQNDPDFTVLPRYWVPEAEVNERLARRGWDKGWLLGWRDIARSTDERTMVCSTLPRTAIGNKIPLLLSARVSPLLGASMSSFVLDFVVRQKVAGTTLNYFLVEQFPVLPPEIYNQVAPWDVGATLATWLESRVMELTYTAWDMEGFANDLRDDGPPFCWDEERRFAMRAELDAAFFHLYGTDRGDVDYIIDTFPVVKKKDEQRYGTFRTKELILEIYDAMTEAAGTGKPYQTVLDPPPGQGPRHG